MLKMQSQSVMEFWWPWLMPGVAYLLGSVSFAWIAGRLNGIDLREHGSKSLGATNAGRILGRKWFFFVFALDVTKGWAPVFIAAKLHGHGGNAVLLLLIGAAAVIGHIYTCFHSFKGGKAVATSLGVLIAFLPWVAAVSFTIWLIALLSQWALSKCSRSDAVGPASVIAAVAAPIVHLRSAINPWGGPELPLTVFIVILSAIIVLKHRSNIAKFFAHTQSNPTGSRKCTTLSSKCDDSENG